LAGRGKPQFGTYAAFASLAVNIPLNLCFIPKWGISGAALSSSIAYIIAALMVTITFIKISNRSWSEVLFIKNEDFQDYKNLLAKLGEKGKQMSSRFPFSGRIDRSTAALNHVRTEKKLSSIENLSAVQDREFDIVSCLEVIEQLPLDIYDKALSEITRVSSHYVLIATPYKQSIRTSLCECPSCHTRFNPNYHMCSYDEDTLRALLSCYGFEPVRVQKIGLVSSLLFIEVYSCLNQFAKNHVDCFRKAKAKQFPKYTICPVCYYNENEKLYAIL